MVKIGSNFLENVAKHKVLGAVVDNKLLWSSHIDYVTENAVCASKPSTESKISSLFNAFILSQMVYCSAVWNGAAPKEINRLFKDR